MEIPDFLLEIMYINLNCLQVNNRFASNSHHAGGVFGGVSGNLKPR